jgi:hypothetical protein
MKAALASAKPAYYTKYRDAAGVWHVKWKPRITCAGCDGYPCGCLSDWQILRPAMRALRAVFGGGDAGGAGRLAAQMFVYALQGAEDAGRWRLRRRKRVSVGFVRAVGFYLNPLDFDLRWGYEPREMAQRLRIRADELAAAKAYLGRGELAGRVDWPELRVFGQPANDNGATAARPRHMVAA